MILMELTQTDAIFSRTTKVLFLCRNKGSWNGTKLCEDFFGINKKYWSQDPVEGHPSSLLGTRPHRLPLVVLGSSIFPYLYRKSLQSFIPIQELLFLHKNNTMVVLLKTASVRVSFTKIMQIRVQNKRKSVRKCRYDGDVSGVYSYMNRS